MSRARFVPPIAQDSPRRPGWPGCEFPGIDEAPYNGEIPRTSWARRRAIAGVTAGQARDFYRAAASFYRQAPWKAVGEGETIRVECDQLETGPWYVLVLGRKGTLKGLMVCDDWETRRLMDHEDYRSIADRLRNITVHFGGREQISPDDLEKARQGRFEVAGPRAYPAVFRMERGREFRTPSAWELELLEACLWVIPDFLKRAEDRAPEVLEYAFEGTIGRMTLNLSWVPLRRPGAGNDAPRT